MPAVKVAAMLVAMAIWGTAVVGMVVGGIVGTRVIIHNPVCMHLLPHRIVWPQCVMVHPILGKRTLHPALQSVTTLTSECDANPGMMWARRAMAESLGKSNVHVCVDCTWSPLGRHAMVGFLEKFYVGDGVTGGEEVARCVRIQKHPFVDGIHVNIECAKECGGGKCILGRDWARR